MRNPVAVRTLSVCRIRQLTPNFLRVTLSGSELDGFVGDGPTDHVKLSLPPDGVVSRDYTPRAFRPAVGDTLPQLDLDFYGHREPGPATRWALDAGVGDPITVRGPRGTHPVPTGMSRVILIADETALPAFARWIELLPNTVEILGIVELDHESDAAYLDPAHINRARVLWLNKSEAKLERAVRSLGAIGEDTYVWAAGEATTLIPIRRYLRQDRSLTAGRLKVDGYWKRGEAGRDHHAPIDPADPQ